MNNYNPWGFNNLFFKWAVIWPKVVFHGAVTVNF